MCYIHLPVARENFDTPVKYLTIFHTDSCYLFIGMNIFITADIITQENSLASSLHSILCRYIIMNSKIGVMSTMIIYLFCWLSMHNEI